MFFNNTIKQILIKCHLLGVAKHCLNLCFCWRSFKCQIMAKRRKNGYVDKRYDRLLKYKNIYNNKRCFIIATGPSLKLEDVEKLENEITFSMNSIVKIFNKTNWRPTYYGIQDGEAYQSLSNDTYFSEIKNKFIGDFMLDKLYSQRIPLSDISSDSILFPTDMLNHRNYKNKFYKIDFSDDAYSIVYEGSSITYSLMQIAVYMGFKEIYLLGCDCNYTSDHQHFVDYGKYVNDNPENNMILAFNKAKEFADKHGIKIYNATRGGNLEVFERVDFDNMEFI